MEFFWDTVETVNRTECNGFSHFDTGHITWLVLFLCAAAAGIILYARLDKGKVRFAFAVLLIVDELLKYVIILKGHVSVIGYLPLQLCSISIILVIIHAIASGTKLRGGVFLSYLGNFLYLIGLPAGLAALLFPSWTALPSFGNFMSIHSFSVHIIMVVYIVMMLSAKEIRPEIKRIPVCVLALIAMAIGVYFFDVALGTNYMYLVHISPGSPLAPFRALGDYRIGYAVILAALIAVMYGVPALISSRSQESSTRCRKCR